MTESLQPTTRLRDYRPEPSNLWIQHAAVWEAPDDLVWVDVAKGGLGGVDEGRPGGGRRFALPQDVLYLPPGGPLEERALLQASCTEREMPFYLHHVLGDTPPEPLGAAGMVLADPLRALIEGQPELLGEVEAGALVIWPTLSHLTDEESLLEAGLGRLQAAGVSGVIPYPVALTPAAGRKLTERFGDTVFDAVFHGGDVDVLPVVRACRALGLEFLPQRPPLPAGDAFGRRAAAELALIGELWAVSGESPAGAQEFFRAAAWIEDSRFDLRALVRDDNLGIVPSLSPNAATVIRQLAAGAERSSRLAELVEQFAAPAA